MVPLKENIVILLKLDCHIVEIGLSLFFHSSVPHIYWNDAFLTSTYLINRLPTASLGISPHEKLHQQAPDFSFFKIFGCACFTFLQPFNKHKLDFRSKLCIFLSYKNLLRYYKCLNLNSSHIFVPHHVIFDETSFPFCTHHTPPALPFAPHFETTLLPIIFPPNDTYALPS